MKIWQKFTLAVAATAALFVGGAVAGQHQASAAPDYSMFEKEGIHGVTHVNGFTSVVKLLGNAPVIPATSSPKMATKTPSAGVKTGVDALITTKSGIFYELNNAMGSGYINAKYVRPENLGTMHVNYNKHYGIQIWDQYGNPVRYNKVEAKKMHHKVNDAKKLPGQTNWKMFGFAELFNKDGKKVGNYVNLGGDQYIDANFVTITFAKEYENTFQFVKD